MKKYFLLLTLLALSFVFVANAQTISQNRAKLIGVWKINMFLNSSAANPENFPPLEITKIEGNTFYGKVYGADIKKAKICDCPDKKAVLYIAFTTEDNGKLVSHFAKLVGNHLEGATHFLDNNILLPWEGEKKEQDKKEQE